MEVELIDVTKAHGEATGTGLIMGAPVLAIESN